MSPRTRRDNGDDPQRDPAPMASRDSGTSTGRHIGTIARLVRDKGFGFIKVDAQEYFFHRSAVSDYDGLTEGASVSFDGMNTMKGLRATNVVRA